MSSTNTKPKNGLTNAKPKNGLTVMIDINKDNSTFNLFDVNKSGRVMYKANRKSFKTLDAIKTSCMAFGYKFHSENASHVYYKESAA